MNRSTMTSERYVFVALPGQTDYVVAGRFRHFRSPSDHGALGEFVYGRSYLSRSDAVEIDPVDLRLTTRVLRTQAFALRDAMPSFWGRFTDAHPMAMVGALVFASGPALPKHKKFRFDSVDALGRLQDAIDAKPVDEDTPLNVAYAPKTIVEDRHTLWLATFQQDGTSILNQPRVQLASLQLARECGLDVIPSRLVTVRGRDILLIERLDRSWTGAGYACARLISGRTLLGTEAAAGRGWKTYLALADAIRRTSSHPRQDLHELFGRLCFNVSIRNVRDDLRRPMLVAQGGAGWRLPPLIETCTLTPSVAGNVAANRAEILASAGRFLLDREAAENIYYRIAEIVRSSWFDVLRQSGVSVRDCELVGRAMATQAVRTTD